MPRSNELKTIRENLMAHGLSEADAPADPMCLFDTWMAYAEELKFHNANAMTLATVNEGSEPSLRNVLLRGHADGGFVFYTNYESRKGRDLAQKETAAALFCWLELERQIRLTGSVEKMKPETIVIPENEILTKNAILNIVIWIVKVEKISFFQNIKMK